MKTIDEYIKSIEEQGKTMEVLPTGFPFLDSDLNGGFMRKELVVLGGFTGFGKSYLAGQLLWNIATKGFNAAYFSLEISGEMIVSRLIGSLSNIHPTLIVQNKVLSRDEERFEDAKMDVSNYSKLIDIYDDVYEYSQIERIIRSKEYAFVVIDFIQNVMTRGDEYERMSAIPLYLQKLAKEKNCCILALSQISNSAAKSNEKEGESLVEYKGSGGIAMVADLGFMMARGSQDRIILKIKKNRRGPSGQEFRLQFENPGGRIYEK